MQTEAIDLIRSSDGLMLVVDLSADPSEQLRYLIKALEEVHISTDKPHSRVEIIREKGWGPTSKFEGKRVGPDHVLGDRDVVEIHTA